MSTCRSSGTSSARNLLEAHLAALGGAWPEFLLHDRVSVAYHDRNHQYEGLVVTCGIGQRLLLFAGEMSDRCASGQPWGGPIDAASGIE